MIIHNVYVQVQVHKNYNQSKI